MMRAVLSDKGCPESKPETLQKALFYTVVGCDIQFSLVVRGVNARIRHCPLGIVGKGAEAWKAQEPETA